MKFGAQRALDSRTARLLKAALRSTALVALACPAPNDRPRGGDRGQRRHR